MIDKIRIGKRICFHRKKIGLSQAALAEKLNVSTQAVSKWETGLSVPDIALLLELSWLFDISVNNILEGTENYTGSAKFTLRKLPEQAERILNLKEDKKLLSSLISYFSNLELVEIGRQLAADNLKLNFFIKASMGNKQKTIKVELNTLSENSLLELAPFISDTFNLAVGNIPKPIKRIGEMLICPECGGKMNLIHNNDDESYFICPKKHTAKIIDGVICFNTREIPGEQWSLSLRNYEHYLEWKNAPGNPNYLRGRQPGDVIFKQLEEHKPKIILDIATGMAGGIGRIIDKIDWPCMLILTDLSYRILSWDKKYYETFRKNPYVDMVYISCDCAKIPIKSESIDALLSCAGFESMREKKMMGFSEAYRILKNDAAAIYQMSIVEDKNTANSKKWIELILSLKLFNDKEAKEQLVDLKQWLVICKKQGFAKTKSIKLYGELPAPETNVFPFEDEVMQWMCNYVFISKKNNFNYTKVMLIKLFIKHPMG